MKKYSAKGKKAIAFSIMLLLTMYSLWSLASTGLTINLKRTDNTVQVTIQDASSKIVSVRVIKGYISIEDIDIFETSKEVRVLSIEPSKEVITQFTLYDGYGSYTVFAQNEKGEGILGRIQANEKTPPILKVDSDVQDRRKLHIQVEDESNIQLLKIAKKDTIEQEIDYAQQGETIVTPVQNKIDTYYTCKEDGIYEIFAQDVWGNSTRYRIIVRSASVISVQIQQNPEELTSLTITARNSLVDIKTIKVMVGNSISNEELKQNGEVIPITPQQEITFGYKINGNCKVNVYVEDVQGFWYIYRMSFYNIDKEEDTTPPVITLVQKKNTIEVEVVDTQSYIRKIKKAMGDHDISYFQENGTGIGEEFLGKMIKTSFSISQIGTYTVYAEDNEGNKTIKKLQITNLEEETKMKGDINGDGKISILDLSKLRLRILEKIVLEDKYEQAADNNQDGKVSILDLSRLRLLLLGKIQEL